MQSFRGKKKHQPNLQNSYKRLIRFMKVKVSNENPLYPYQSMQATFLKSLVRSQHLQQPFYDLPVYRNQMSFGSPLNVKQGL